MQEQEKKNKRAKKNKSGSAKKRALPVLLSASPQKVFRAHLAQIIIEGKNLDKKSIDGIRATNTEIVDAESDNSRQVSLLLRLLDGTTDGSVKIYLDAGESTEDSAIEIELKACPVEGMSVIPGGEFIFGSDDGAPTERPSRKVELPEYACGLHEVSNREYLEFLNYIADYGDHSKCHPDEDPTKSHIPDRWDDATIRHPDKPVTGVDWYDAYAYAAWCGYRLPTEEEWEKASRGVEGAPFPWGEEPNQRLAQSAESGPAATVVLAHAQGRSPFGLYNACGNVWEWTASNGPAVGNAVVRGGSFRNSLLECRTFVRNWVDRKSRRDDIGFRCAADLNEEIWRLWAEKQEKLKQEGKVEEKPVETDKAKEEGTGKKGKRRDRKKEKDKKNQ